MTAPSFLIESSTWNTLDNTQNIIKHHKKIINTPFNKKYTNIESFPFANIREGKMQIQRYFANIILTLWSQSCLFFNNFLFDFITHI